MGTAETTQTQEPELEFADHLGTPPENFEEVVEGIGLRVPRSALLYSCPACGYWNVLIMQNSTINRTLTHGSKRAKLSAQRQQPCTQCGKFGLRLHSTRQTRIVAQIDASKAKQLLDLRAVAEEMNAMLEIDGETPTEHDANAAWFAMSKNRRQGKGRKYWGLPFRRWAATLNKGEC
jgi:hypothetical protein